MLKDSTTTQSLVAGFEKRANEALRKLGLPHLRCVWHPDAKAKERGRLDLEAGIIFVFDATEEEAQATLIHELIELRLRDMTKVYRTVINALIDAFEKIAYERKESTIEGVARDLRLVFDMWASNNKPEIETRTLSGHHGVGKERQAASHS